MGNRSGELEQGSAFTLAAFLVVLAFTLSTISVIGASSISPQASIKPALSAAAPAPLETSQPGTDEISFTVSFDEPQIRSQDGYDLIEIAGCEQTGEPGKPMVPARGVLVLLPPGADVSSIVITSLDRSQPINGEVYLHPGQHPYPLIEGAEPEFTPPDPEIYESANPYPGDVLELQLPFFSAALRLPYATYYSLNTVTSIRGYRIASLTLFPITYTPSGRRAIFHSQLRVSIRLGEAADALAFRPADDVTEWIGESVVNPELMSLYGASGGESLSNGSSSGVSGSSSSSSGAEYLIITRPMFISALQPLVDQKSGRMSVKVMTVDDIVTSYPGGNIPEKIRNCIKDHYTNQGTKWVLLAGDADYDDLDGMSAPNYVLDKSWEVPVYYVYNPDEDDSSYTGVTYQWRPTDFPYAGLDGDSWNFDWFAEVYVGRFSARDVPTMQTIVNKTVAFERDPPRELRDVCLFGATLFNDYADGKTLKEHIRSSYISPAGVSAHGYYRKDGTLSYSAFVNAINSCDPMRVNAAAHGSPYEMSITGYAGNPFVNTSTPGSIANKGFTMFAMSCLTNAYDVSGTCLGEALQRDPDGGSVGYIGGTRVEWGWTGSDYFLTWGSNGQDVKFFEQIFTYEEYHQGAALYKSVAKYIQDGWYNPVGLDALETRACLLNGMLLGDPELAMMSVGPSLTIKVSPDPSNGATTITVTCDRDLVSLTVTVTGPDNIENEIDMENAGTFKWTGTYTVTKDGTHTVKAVGTDAEGQVGESTRTFVGDFTPPPAPTLAWPANGENINNNTPDLDWNSVSDNSPPVLYRCYVDDDSGFSSIDYDSNWIADDNYKVPSPLADGVWYWKVQAKDNMGYIGENSASRSFRVDVTAPSAPSLVSPENNENIPDTTPTFKWTSMSDPSSVTYMLQYSTDPSFPPSWFDPAWSYRRKITIDNTKVDNNLTDFPVAVILNSSNFDFSKARSDGYDIRFTQSDGTTPLKYERERHNSDDNEAEYWVKIPHVSSSDNTEFYIYYGNENASDNADPTNVWDNNFKLVTHMKDDPDTSHVKDSTSNANNGTKKAANEPIESDGKIAKAENFDGTNDYVNTSNPSSLQITQNITVAVWAKRNINQSDTGMINKFYTYSPGWTYLGWTIRSDSDGKYGLLLGNGALGGDTPGKFAYLWTSSTYSNDWHYVVFVENNNNNDIYVDGVLASGSWSKYNDGTGSGTLSYAWVESTKDLHIGDEYANSDGAPSGFFNGSIDEVRICNTARSAAWIKASYNSENSTFLSYGSEEVLGETRTIEGLSENSYTVPDDEALLKNTYYWRVRAVDGAGNTGDWSDVWTLTIDTTAPPVPLLVSPDNGAVITDNTPTFFWSSVTDPSGVTYQIQVDDNDDFSSPVYSAVDLTEITHTLPDEDALALGAYFWHVRAKDGAGNVGDWSEEWNFTVVPIGAIGILLMPLLMLLPFVLMLRRQKRRYF